MIGGRKMDDETVLTIEELDELLAKEFNKPDSPEEEQQPDEVEEEESTEEEVEDTDDSEVGEPESTEESADEEHVEEAPKKGKSPEEKKDYAFAKLRKEASEAKKLAEEKAKQAEEYDNLLRVLMTQSGFEDLGSFKKALEKQVSEQERKAKGYTEDEYKKVKSIEQREAELKKREEEMKQKEFNSRAQMFDNTVREVIKEYNLKETDREKVYLELETLGYTADTLLSIPSPRHLIKGIVVDMRGSEPEPVVRKTVDTQRIITPVNKESLATKQDELLAKELKEYERNKYGR